MIKRNNNWFRVLIASILFLGCEPENDFRKEFYRFEVFPDGTQKELNLEVVEIRNSNGVLVRQEKQFNGYVIHEDLFPSGTIKYRLTQVSQDDFDETIESWFDEKEREVEFKSISSSLDTDLSKLTHLRHYYENPNDSLELARTFLMEEGDSTEIAGSRRIQTAKDQFLVEIFSLSDTGEVIATKSSKLQSQNLSLDTVYNFANGQVYINKKLFKDSGMLDSLVEFRVPIGGADTVLVQSRKRRYLSNGNWMEERIYRDGKMYLIRER